jgi:hypothetical protein
MMSPESFETISREVNVFLSNFQNMSDEEKLPFKECVVGFDAMPFDRSYRITVSARTPYGDEVYMAHDLRGHLLVSFLHVTTREERIEMAAEIQRVIHRICEDLDEAEIVADSRYVDAPDPTFQEVKVTPKKADAEPEEPEEEPEDIDYSIGLNFDLLS